VIAIIIVKTCACGRHCNFGVTYSELLVIGKRTTLKASSHSVERSAFQITQIRGVLNLGEKRGEGRPCSKNSRTP